MDDTPIRKRKSKLKACYRCHRRKQRCVGYPTCSNCLAGNAACVRETPPTSGRFAGLSKQELVEKLEIVFADREAPADRWRQSTASPTRAGADYPDGPQDGDAAPEEGGRTSNDENGRHVSLCSAGDADDPAQPTPDNEVWDKEATPQGHLSPLQSENDRLEKAPPPDDRLGEQLLTTYLENMHRRTPYLDLADILDMHARRHSDLLADAPSRHGGFRLYMIYAIAAAIMRITRPYTSTLPERYFATALHFKRTWEGEDPVRDIEAILLILYYKLRMSLDSRMWYLVGLGVRTAIDAGMHREYSYRGLDPKKASARRRIFWSIYGLERRVAWSLRRPFCLADYDIDTEEPAASDYYIPDSIASVQRADHPLSGGPVAARSQVHASAAVFGLTRIMSRVYVDIHRVDKPIADLKKEVPTQLALLRQFESTLPKIAARDQDWVTMHYQDCVRKVIEPFLRMLQPHDELMQICLQASGHMCQLFRRMRMRSLSAYSFLMINSFFIAGMNICYILFKAPFLWSTATSNDLRACSSTLSAMAETNPSLRKYRDVLESIIDSTMEHVDQFSQPAATSVCRCANCNPSVHGDNGEENRSAFHQLGGTFTRLKFEFPSQSYPEYTLGFDRAGRTRPTVESSTSSGRSTDAQHPPLQHQHQHPHPFPHHYSPISYSRVPGYGQDVDNFVLPDLWDFSGMDAAGGPAAPFLAGGEPFLQQSMDEFLLRGAQRDRFAYS
ncbi:uncharacterized protein PV07_00442 [Cladophialophora immunda]|uniref:Zn(2)-C6 fungal-type domain-containing protein n=1 Tax=Cladophialophora immunda TaxID=569365 RepID=A0A0D1ZZP0_9EURO|nr:uncharacterized protein PV07_00442 [Cladophialophora immunda]KIW33606.1 hypothetical protein PV07_00442 [Cladophialophora immunda]